MALPDPDQLARLGLTTYEAKAYLALIRRESSAAADVARLARLPRQRIYDVLAGLVERGLVSSYPGSPAKYSAVPPDAAIERLLSDRREELKRLEREGEALAEQLGPAFHDGRVHNDPLQYIEVLRDRNAINERFGELQAGLEREILVFTKPPYATPPQENVDGVEVARTHVARSVYELSVFEDAAFVEGMRRFIEAGEEARFVPELPLKLVIIDETVVMFGMQDPVGGASEATIMVVEHPSLAQLLKVAFNTVWEQGLSFEEAHERFAPLRAEVG
jgi:HTH-type transcriptional regulator, sugar sensing transcriptional regulator